MYSSYFFLHSRQDFPNTRKPLQNADHISATDLSARAGIPFLLIPSQSAETGVRNTFPAPLFAPLGGLPSRLHQIRKSLSLFACVRVRIFTDFYRMVSAPATNAEFYRVFETGSEKRSVSSSNSSGNEPNRGTRFFSSLFHKKFDQKTNRLMMPCASKTRLLEA